MSHSLTNTLVFTLEILFNLKCNVSSDALLQHHLTALHHRPFIAYIIFCELPESQTQDW